MALSFEAQKSNRYVGTLVGESTSREFRLAVAHETIREQDIIAVDAALRSPENDVFPEQLRVWAKVQRIERLNPRNYPGRLRAPMPSAFTAFLGKG